MTENWKYQISPKINDQLVNVRGEDAADFAENLANFPFDAVAQFTANLNGAGAVAQIAQPSVVQAPPVQQAAPGWATQAPAAAPAPVAAPQGGGEFCGVCGNAAVYKEVKGGQFKLWACPNQKSKGDGHYVKFVN